VTTGVCPQCGEAALQPDPQGGILCRQCGALFKDSPVPCPACGSEVEANADECAACGAPLGVTAQILAQRAGQASTLWLERTRAQAPALKASGAEGSRERLETLVKIDRRREQQWAKQIAARAVEDRRSLGLLAAALGIFVVVLGIALLVTLLR